MSTDAAMPLAAQFPAKSEQEWEGLVAAVLNRSRSEDQQLTGQQARARLATTLPGGLTVDPLYLAPEHPRALGLPGQMPFTRGRTAHAGAWDVRQLHDDPEVELTRAAIADDLEHGVTSLWLRMGAGGIAASDLAAVLADVPLDQTLVEVVSADDQAGAAAALADVLATVPGSRGHLGFDPLGAAARRGSDPEVTSSVLAPVVEALAHDPEQLGALTIDATGYRDAGATAQEEIAYAVATALATVRAVVDQGVDVATVMPHLQFRVSATADQFLTIAALRALRTLWARVGEVLGVPEEERGARIHAVSALRMFTRDDPWVNVLRCTVSTFAASVGGADAITVLPYDTVAGLPEKFSRRLARNTQIVLADEANIARVADPAGGSWYVESLTDEVADAAWSIVQQIESAGGMAAALKAGLVERRLAEARAQTATAVSTRRQPLTGVSMFPASGEVPLTRRERAAVPGDGLPVHRDSAVFEALRDRAAQLDPAPVIPIAALGARRDFGARETFVANLLAAGGLRTQTLEGSAQEIAAQVSGRHTPVVAVASSPKGYAAHAGDALTALREAGVETLVLAGRSRELGDRAAEADLEAFDGADIVALLDTLLTRLGAPAEGADR